jgi:hypothetical protein
MQMLNNERSIKTVLLAVVLLLDLSALHTEYPAKAGK